MLKRIEKVAVLGAGTMGSRIAAHLANAGIPVLLLDLVSKGEGAERSRLAKAARDLPATSGEIEPLPLEGPTEVKVLTERFNAMADELASTRHEETAMLANLRHDLRTPLTSIGGYAEAIADGTAKGERAVAAGRTIAEEAQRLERLVGELGVVAADHVVGPVEQLVVVLKRHPE